jgi:hypothetical protein
MGFHPVPDFPEPIFSSPGSGHILHVCIHFEKYSTEIVERPHLPAQKPMGLHNYQRSFSPATLLLFTLLLVPIFAIYIPCEPGYGLVDPDKSQPDEKSCQPCQIKGCGMCTWGTWA